MTAAQPQRTVQLERSEILRRHDTQDGITSVTGRRDAFEGLATAAGATIPDILPVTYITAAEGPQIRAQGWRDIIDRQERNPGKLVIPIANWRHHTVVSATLDALRYHPAFNPNVARWQRMERAATVAGSVLVGLGIVGTGIATVERMQPLQYMGAGALALGTLLLCYAKTISSPKTTKTPETQPHRYPVIINYRSNEND